MVAPALKTKDIPEWKAEIDARKAKASSKKKFSELTAPEKDGLLQAVALRLGLVKPE
jgi:hypothetical protein